MSQLQAEVDAIREQCIGLWRNGQKAEAEALAHKGCELLDKLNRLKRK